MIEQIGVARAYIGIGERSVYFKRLGNHPLAFAVVTAVLGYLANVDFGVEVGCKSLAMVAGIAVNYVEILHFREIVLGGVGSEYARHSGVKSAAENSRQSGLLEAFAIGPLPRVLKVSLILGLIVGSVKIVDATFKTGVHNRKVLIRQGHVDYEVGLVTVEQSHELLYFVGIDRVGCDVGSAYSLGDCITLAFGARCKYNLGEHIGILRTLVSDNGSYAAGSDYNDF